MKLLELAKKNNNIFMKSFLPFEKNWEFEINWG